MKFKIAEAFNLNDLDFVKVFVHAGKAYEKQIKEEDVDAKELEMGIAVEHEHTTNEDIARRISLDHLSEISDYYTRLAKMEEQGKKAQKEKKSGGADDAEVNEEEKEEESEEGENEDREDTGEEDEENEEEYDGRNSLKV